MDQEIVERKRLTGYVAPEEILSVVANSFKTNIEALQNQGGRNNTAKKVAIYLIKRYSGLSNREIGQMFGGVHYSAISQSSKRLEVEMENNENLHKLIRDLMSNVKT